MRLFAIAFALAACQSSSSSTSSGSSSASNQAVARPAGKLELVDAPPTPAGANVATTIANEVTRAGHDGKELVVYVGATWCEPCQQFHAAAAAGKLDQAFPKLRLLVFDNDRDGDALQAAGYRSRLIPLFALPNADGTSSGKQIEGSVKGADAVKQISPRLEALLGG
ncbi:MAG TPA: thioredoxin family protein [Kofleriaceae bacterium]|jgi:thiol-disulfide isomerase/thioredoxin